VKFYNILYKNSVLKLILVKFYNILYKNSVLKLYMTPSTKSLLNSIKPYEFIQIQ